MENLPQEQRKQRLIQSKPSEKGEIITYLSRMGDVLHDIAEGCQLIFSVVAIHTVVDGDKTDAVVWEIAIRVVAHLQIVTAQTGHIFLCQVGTKKILRIYKPFIGGQPPVNGLRFLYALLPFFV